MGILLAYTEELWPAETFTAKHIHKKHVASINMIMVGNIMALYKIKHGFLNLPGYNVQKILDSQNALEGEWMPSNNLVFLTKTRCGEQHTWHFLQVSFLGTLNSLLATGKQNISLRTWLNGNPNSHFFKKHSQELH